MQERDLPFIMEIERLSFPTPWRESSFQGEIENLHISYPNVIVQRPYERIIGYIIFWHEADKARVSNFALHPDFRGLGVGESVMEETLNIIRTMGALHVVLEVRPSNTPAISLYQKFGFTPLGMRPGYYQNPPEDAMVMIRYFGPTPED
ncbi:MAG: ribosomal protein S18-alanine N-acetyltransferase [Candidatus Aminicenantaceae bacterium]